MKATESFTFYSGVGNLVQGNLLITPEEDGLADLTVFSIDLVDSLSDYLPVTFDLYGLQDDFSPPF